MKINKANLTFGSMNIRSKTTLLVLHHAAAKKCSVEDIHRWHKENGWSGMGYHFLVRKDGTIWEGRPINTVGAHAYGYNSESVGICFEGNFETETMTKVQKEAGKELVSYIIEKYPEISSVKGHGDLMATACPGKNFPFDEIKKGVTTSKATAKKAYPGNFPTLPERGYFQYGDEGTQVKRLQKLLNWYGGYNLDVDGIFGSLTQRGVIKYQENTGLDVDGLFGAKSLGKAKSLKK